MVQDIAKNCDQYLSDYQREDSEDQWAKNFMSLVVIDNLYKYVWWVTDMEKGGPIIHKTSDQRKWIPFLRLSRQITQTRGPQCHI